MRLVLAKVAACLVAVLGSAAAQNASLPVVDLGYELHQAAFYNASAGLYNFSNIRYAAPPLGNLRFAPPQSPSVDRSNVQTGSVGRICPQANPSWIGVAGTWITEFLTGKNITITQAQLNALNASVSANNLTAMDGRTTEDCLFLDVVVPKAVFDNAGKGYGAPVLVWIYGGGYTGGDKSGSGNPAGLLMQSETSGGSQGGSQGVIYVSMNYRLGALGWSSGPTFTSTGGTANLGLYDQRAALEWVQSHIAAFGGDPNRVTVFGESAGGGSIMHQITAYGGLKGPSPFQQAVPQSPGFQPTTSNYQQENTFQRFLQLLNVSTLAEARALSSQAVIVANAIQVGQSEYGGFVYGPVVDGTFVPRLPGLLLAQGAFDKSLRVMVGHNADEGLLFTDPLAETEAELEYFLRQTIPDVSDAILDYIGQVLYPPVFDGSYGYTNQIERSALLISEFIFTCNTVYLDHAYNDDDYSYFFTVPPAIHGQDVAYTYYNGGGVNFGALLLNVTVAKALQDYITSFAELGRPQAPEITGTPLFAMYGNNSQVQDLGLSAITRVMDPAANARCAWWQLGLYN